MLGPRWHILIERTLPYLCPSEECASLLQWRNILVVVAKAISVPLFTCLLLLFFSFQWHCAYGQSYSFAQYEVEDGLVQSSVNHFMQDHFGNLWIATAGGVSRFDGDEFTNFYVQDGVAGSNVFFLYEDSRHRVMMGTNMGLTVYDGVTFQNYQVRDSSGTIMSVREIWEDSQGQIRLLLELDNISTFTGDSILFSESDQVINEEIRGQYVTGITQDSKGVVWICTYRGGLYTWDYQHFVRLLSEDEGLAYRFSELFIDEQEKVWLLDVKNIVEYDPENKTLQPMDLKLPEFERTYTLVQDNQGMLWVGTTNGTFCFDPQTQQIDPRSLALSGSIVHTVFKDRDGNMWFGSFGDGVYKFKGRMFTKLRTEEGLSVKTIMAVTKNQRGDLWLGSYGSGIDRWSNGKVYHYGISEGVSSEFITSVVEDSIGAMWFGSWHGLNHFKGEEFINYTTDDGLPTNIVYFAMKDSQNQLWFGTRQGVVSFEEGKFKPLYTQNDSLFREEVTSIVELRNGSLVIVAHQGVFITENGKVKPLLQPDLFHNEMITAVVLDKEQHLLFATINGLIYHYDIERAELSLLNKSNDIPQSMIYSMIFADDGSLLVGTQRGIFRLFFGDDRKIVKTIQYGKNEGFLGVEANTNAVFKERDGSIWFGTVNGAYKFNPAKEETPKDKVQTHLTGVKLYYEDIDWSSRTDYVSPWYHVPENLELDYKSNHLVFTFKAISLASPDAVRYRFMLENFDAAWSPETDRTEAVYANIPPGTYTFKVLARNLNSDWSEIPTTFSFKILPPFWQTWWFYVLLASLLTILIKLYILWNLRRERQRRQQLEGEVENRTREISALNDSLEQRVKKRTAELEQSNKKLEVEFKLRKLDQERLAQKEKEYRMLVNNLREVIFRTDSQGNFTFLNHRWQEYTGYSIQESLGTHFTQYLHFEEMKSQLRAFYALVRDEIPYFEIELRVNRKNGSTFWGKISARPEYDEEGKPIGMYGSLVDIDLRKRAEFALKGSEERHKFLAENTQDIIALHGSDLVYIYVSPRIQEVAGLDPQDLLGKKPMDFLHPEDQAVYMAFHDEVMHEKANKGKILRFRDNAGEYRWYETFLKPILDENGEVKSFISSSRDITDKVIISKEIEKVRKKVAQDFHDEMGNNLASISVLSQIIQTKLGNQQNGIEALLIKIDTAAKNLFHGTRDFIWAIDPKNDNLKEVYFNLKDFGEDLFDNTGISFYSSFESDEDEENLKLPSGWSRQIVLIFKEALTNALKYSQATRVCIQFVLKEECFYISLIDDGVGFDVEHNSTSHRGLQNMKDRANKINVWLGVSSEKNKGTQICLEGKITQNGLIKA